MLVSRRVNLLPFLIILFLFLLAIVYLAAKGTFGDNQQTTPYPSESDTQLYQSTTSFEKTAIAVFTQNPTLALSSTPFYAEIIFDDTLRQITETPYHGALTIPSTSKCSPALSNIVLSELSGKIMQMLKSRNIDARVLVVSSGVEGIDSDCRIPFQAVHSRIDVGVDLENLDDNSRLTDLGSRILDFLMGYWDKMEDVAKKCDILVSFHSGEDNISMNTSYDALVRAYTNGLRGDALVASLGGFTRGH